MNHRNSSRDLLNRSSYENLDQSQGEESTEMQSLRSHQSESSTGSQNETTAPNDCVMTIGVGVWLAIATSFFVLIAAVIFLTWLWFEDRNSESWRRFMLSGRATQSITLMSVLIRWAIGILSAITTSMAASIALEIHGVPMSALAEVSIARFTNSGPQSFKKMLPGTTFRLWLRILMIFLFALVVASQFSSTLLVSDLRELNILSLKKNLTYGFTFGGRNGSDPRDLTPLPLSDISFNYWERTPSQSEIFAEYSEPAESSDELDDTGTVLRAFLPISTKAQRESIQSFNGIARVIDTRVICVRPKFTARYCQMEGLPSVWGLCLNVTADLSNFPSYHIYNYISDSYRLPRENKTRVSSSFVCPLPGLPFGITPKRWLLCKGPFKDTSMVALDSPLERFAEGQRVVSFLRYSYRLLIDISSIATATPFFVEDTTNATWTLLNSSSSGPWARQWNRIRLTDGVDTRDEHIQATLCFGPQLSSDIEHLTITASSTTNSTEPTYSFDISSNRYNTSAVLKQLGVGGKMASKRQILDISPGILKQSLKDRHQNLTSGGTPGDEEGSWLGDREGIWLGDDKFPDLAICCSCGLISTQTPELAPVSPLMWQIFNDTLNTTNSPALAIQALTTIVWRMAYYDHITSYSQALLPANVTTFDLAQVPDRQLGFTMLMVIITGNIIIFFVIAFFFLRHIKSSFVENAWHTIAQISQSEEVRPILAKATIETDQNVVRLIRAEEMPKGFMGNVKDFFRDVGRMVDQREAKEERLVLKDGVLVGLRSE